MAKCLQAFLPVAGGMYSLEDAASDCGLADLWPGDGQRETVRVLLRGALARGGDVLFDVFRLDPRADLRREGEQLDATFELDGHVWLVEAKWTEEQADPSALRDFAAKLAARPGRVLGVFVSVAGFTDGAIGCAKES